MLKFSPEVAAAQLVLFLLVWGFFSYTLYRAIKQVKFHNQKLSPVLVWLLMIPGIQLFASFFVIPRLSDSLKAEFEERNFDITERPGYKLGIWLSCLLLFINLFVYVVPIISLLVLPMLVLLIQYWTKINWYRKVLEKDSLENFGD